MKCYKMDKFRLTDEMVEQEKECAKLIADLENKVAVLIEFGISYNEIKEKIKDISQPLKNIA